MKDAVRKKKIDQILDDMSNGMILMEDFGVVKQMLTGYDAVRARVEYWERNGRPSWAWAFRRLLRGLS